MSRKDNFINEVQEMMNELNYEWKTEEAKSYWNILCSQEDKEKPMFTDNGKIILKDGQEMEFELYPEIAPITVENFIKLAKEGFYEGLTFHRVIKGFVIQGGCPKGNGTGGPGYTIKGEFKSNGVDNPIKHEVGVLSMARSMAPNSAGSQFFIMVGNMPHLDGQYAAFGKITKNVECALNIAKTRTDHYDRPITPVIIEKVEIF